MKFTTTFEHILDSVIAIYKSNGHTYMERVRIIDGKQIMPEPFSKAMLEDLSLVAVGDAIEAKYTATPERRLLSMNITPLHTSACWISDRTKRTMIFNEKHSNLGTCTIEYPPLLF